MLKGSCFCSKVSYEVDGSLQNVRACHCSRCRKMFGGASSALADLSPGSVFRWTSGDDALSIWEESDGGKMGFCARCGSTLSMWKGEYRVLPLGCVDGDPSVELEAHLFVGSKASWDHIGDDVPQFDEYPQTPKKV